MYTLSLLFILVSLPFWQDVGYLIDISQEESLWVTTFKNNFKHAF